MIIIKQGDITQEEVDGIVNAANTSLTGGGGVDGAIHRAAGPSVLEECLMIGGCNTSEAVATRAGHLKAKKIIHTVGPMWQGGQAGEAEQLKLCYENTFQLAKKLNLKSIAFPAISTGVFGFPLEAATEIAVAMGLQFEKEFSEIRYLCFDQKAAEIYQATLARLRTSNK